MNYARFCLLGRFMGCLLLLLTSTLLQGQSLSCLQDSHCLALPLRVNLIVLQRADGTGNFQDNAADRAFLWNMISVTNDVFAHLSDRNEAYFPGQHLPYIPNAKLQILPRVLFVRDEYGWNNRHDTNFAGVPYLSGWYLDSLDRQIYQNDSLPKAINLYFTTDGQLYEQMVLQQSTTDYNRLVFFKQHAASEIPVLQGAESPYGKYHSMRCHVANVWLKLWWKRQVLHEEDWNMEYEAGKSIAHELGHLLGLEHTPDHQTDALMRTRFGGLRDYLSAREVARIHQTLGRYPSIWQCVPEEASYGSSKADWIVTGIETCSENRRLYAGIRVDSGAVLTIQKELLLPPDAFIEVKSGGTLILDGGLVRRINTPVPEQISPGEPRELYTTVRFITPSGGQVLLRSGGLAEVALFERDTEKGP